MAKVFEVVFTGRRVDEDWDGDFLHVPRELAAVRVKARGVGDAIDATSDVWGSVARDAKAGLPAGSYVAVGTETYLVVNGVREDRSASDKYVERKARRFGRRAA